MTFTDYENSAQSYAKAIENKPIHTHYERPNTCRLLPDHLNHCCTLDIGCGSGWYSQHLLNLGAIVTAIDISKAMVELTKTRTNHKATCFAANAEDLSTHFTEATFDIIIAPLVVHYLEDWQAFFKQIHTILKPQGKFIFSTHNPQTTAALLHLDNYFKTQAVEDHWQNPKMTVHYYHKPLQNLFTALQDSQLDIEVFHEPEPSLELAELDKDLYKQLLVQPWFLFFKVTKRHEY